MKCPYCQNADTRVVDSRPIEEGAALRRRRACERCGARFTTHERPSSAPLMVVKNDGRREEFSALKLRGGLLKACSKRPVATQDIERAVEAIEASLRRETQGEVAARRIGQLVMDALYGLDQVAYVRFASVYQQFDDVRLFAQLLDRIARPPATPSAPDAPAPGSPAPASPAPSSAPASMPTPPPFPSDEAAGGPEN